MKYIEISVKTTTFGSELVADILEELTEDGVSIYDKNDLNIPSWDYKDDELEKNYNDYVIVNGYIKKENAENVLKLINKRFIELKNIGMDIGSLEITCSEKESDTWRDVWKTNFKPIKIKNIIICPQWIDYKCAEDEILFKIDPGFAFGTGEHETTSMLINYMQNYNLKGKKILDVGCGSGILGICASLLNAGQVLMSDFDPQAIDAAIINIKLNHVEDKIVCKCADLTKCAQGKYDFVFANLTADILKNLAETIPNYMDKGSIIMMSGILNSRKQEVIALYNSIGYKLISENSKAEWTALIMEKIHG